MGLATHTLTHLGDNKIKLTVTVPVEAVEAACEESAKELATEAKIPGFRPGRASYNVVKQRFGEQAILEHAVENLVRGTLVSALLAENLETVGSPHFNVEKMAPGNELIYSAEIALMPSVKKLADYHKLSVQKPGVEPTAALIDEAKRDLTRMQTKEVRAASGAALQKGDKAVVNMGMKKDGVTIEGGEGKNHGVYTAEAHYIPGFVDQLLGMKEGDEKTFALSFPKEHYQKHLAGQNVDFTVRLNEIFTLETPALDDEFAKSVGLKDAAELETKLRENLRAENVAEADRTVEKNALELLADKSTFDAIPDLLVNEEVTRMTHELEHRIESQGMNLQEYLSSIGKSMADLKLDFTAPALSRIKIMLVLKAVAKQEHVTVSDDELDTELDRLAEQLPAADERRKRIYEPEYREYVRAQLTNKKTIDLLKAAMVK